MVPCKPAKLEYISDTVARITLREGRCWWLGLRPAGLLTPIEGNDCLLPS